MFAQKTMLEAQNVTIFSTYINYICIWYREIFVIFGGFLPQHGEVTIASVHMEDVLKEIWNNLFVLIILTNYRE